MPTDPITLVRRLVEAINHHDWTTLHALLHPAFRRYSMAAGTSGVETAAEIAESWAEWDSAADLRQLGLR